MGVSENTLFAKVYRGWIEETVPFHRQPQGAPQLLELRQAEVAQLPLEATDDAEAFACFLIHLGDVPGPVAVWGEQLHVGQGGGLAQILLSIQRWNLLGDGLGDQFHDSESNVRN